MDTYAIRMRFEIDADVAAVTRALKTAEGVARWWSAPVQGTPGEDGGRFTIGFPDVPQPFAFSVRRDEEHTLAWRTEEFPPWWAGTTIHWRVEPAEETAGTVLHFTHDGFAPDHEIIPVITPAWAMFISQLKQYAETGTPAAHAPA